MDAAAAGSNRAHLDAYWMPFTANRQFKRAPRLLASAQGMYYTSDDGRQILDGTAGLWCVNAGHGRVEIAEAVSASCRRWTMRHRSRWATRWHSNSPRGWREIAPAGLDRVFFTSSGSESVDTALKIALAYQRAIGQGRAPD